MSWSLDFHDLPALLMHEILRADKEGILCPPVHLVFRALDDVGTKPLKVVILGQDPYHTPGKANGLAFGYHPEYSGPLDSSLANIVEEVRRDTGQQVTDLTLDSWAEQGVLLLNTRLTTELHTPLAHKGYGWEQIIPDYLERLGDINSPHVYMLWGAEAQKYRKFINEKYNLVLTTSHPCRFSAHLGFKGCGHFSAANKFLKENHKGEIKWGD